MSEAENRLQRIADLCENCNSLDEAQQIARGGKHETVDGCDKCWVEDVEKKLATAKLRYEKAEAENEKLETKTFRRAVEILLNACDKHSGDNIDPFDVWMAKYGNKCLPCMVDKVAALEAVLKHITPGQLRALAAWLDKTDAQIGHAGDEVQIDLREWVRLLEDLNLNPQNK